MKKTFTQQQVEALFSTEKFIDEAITLIDAAQLLGYAGNSETYKPLLKELGVRLRHIKSWNREVRTKLELPTTSAGFRVD